MNSPPPTEPIIEPDLPIIDPHHHLWFRPEPFLAALEQEDTLMVQSLLPAFRRHARYLFDEFMADLRTGHNVRATVFAEAHAMYRSSGPEAMRSVGEVEFANGIAAMAVDAAEAKDLGLVDLLAPAGQLDEVLKGFVDPLLANSWFTNFATKRLMIETDGMSLTAGLAHTLSISRCCARSSGAHRSLPTQLKPSTHERQDPRLFRSRSSPRQAHRRRTLERSDRQSRYQALGASDALSEPAAL